MRGCQNDAPLLLNLAPLISGKMSALTASIGGTTSGATCIRLKFIDSARPALDDQSRFCRQTIFAYL